jgi:prophage antirepressor-like protein
MTVHESITQGEKINLTGDINPLLFEGEHLVRQVSHEGEIWFVAADVCRVLGVKNVPDAVERLDQDEKGIVTVDTPGGTQMMNAVSEPGVYRLVFTSRKPVAERFKRWLAHEVIPTIRKTGGYGTPTEGVSAANIERRLFPDWSMEEMRTKRGIVDMNRMLYGIMAAQWIAPQLGFPVPPVELIENGRQMRMVLVPQVESAQ